MGPVERGAVYAAVAFVLTYLVSYYVTHDLRSNDTPPPPPIHCARCEKI